jgi:hypothetical protein
VTRLRFRFVAGVGERNGAERKGGQPEAHHPSEGVVGDQPERAADAQCDRGDGGARVHLLELTEGALHQQEDDPGKVTLRFGGGVWVDAPGHKQSKTDSLNFICPYCSEQC